MQYSTIFSKKYVLGTVLMATVACASYSWAVDAPKPAAAQVYPPPAVVSIAKTPAALPTVPAIPPKALAAAPAAIANLPKPSPADVKAYETAMSGAVKINRPLWEKGTKLQNELNYMLISPKFDKVSFMAKVAEIEANEVKKHTNRKDVLASYLAKLSPEKRKIIVADVFKIDPVKAEELVSAKAKKK